MFLLNLDLNANETRVSTLIQLIDHFQKYPDEYSDLCRTAKS